MYLYMLMLSLDHIEDFVYAHKTLFEQTDRLIKIATESFDINGNLINTTGLVSKTDVAGMYVIGGDGNLVSFVGATAEGVKIKAANIMLEGLITANEAFKINEDGSMAAGAGTIGGWSITQTGIVSAEKEQSNPSGGNKGKSRTYLNADGTIGGNLLNIGWDSGKISCGLWDDPILEWSRRYIKVHARMAHPFEPTSAIIQAGNDVDILYGKYETNSLIIEPTNYNDVTYIMPTGLDEYNGVTLRIYNPATRGGNWKPANAIVRYKLKSTDTSYTPFLGKFTGTDLSIPAGKMVVVTGVREQVSGGKFGEDNLKWYVEVTA